MFWGHAGESVEKHGPVFFGLVRKYGMSDSKKSELSKAETTNTAITFSQEKKAFWSFVFKCWKKCFGKKTSRTA